MSRRNRGVTRWYRSWTVAMVDHEMVAGDFTFGQLYRFADGYIGSELM